MLDQPSGWAGGASGPGQRDGPSGCSAAAFLPTGRCIARVPCGFQKTRSRRAGLGKLLAEHLLRAQEGAGSDPPLGDAGRPTRARRAGPGSPPAVLPEMHASLSLMGSPVTWTNHCPPLRSASLPDLWRPLVGRADQSQKHRRRGAGTFRAGSQDRIAPWALVTVKPTPGQDERSDQARGEPSTEDWPPGLCIVL